VILSFKDQGTEDVYNGDDTKPARKACPQEIWKVARRKLDMVDKAEDLRDLKSPGNQLEKLTDDRLGQHGIRINRKYRVCFVWTDQGTENVEITDYH